MVSLCLCLSGVSKLLEREDLDESAKKRLRDPNETPGALWHIYLSKDLHKIQEFLQTVWCCSLKQCSVISPNCKYLVDICT